ncbi:hypothetical protein ACOSQ4_021190 [Xanthoceras sorbifolium]
MMQKVQLLSSLRPINDGSEPQDRGVSQPTPFCPDDILGKIMAWEISFGDRYRAKSFLGMLKMTRSCHSWVFLLW